MNEMEDKNSFELGKNYYFTFPIVLNGQDMITKVSVTDEDLIDEHDG